MQARFVAEARKKELFAMIEAAFCGHNSGKISRSDLFFDRGNKLCFCSLTCCAEGLFSVICVSVRAVSFVGRIFSGSRTV